MGEEPSSYASYGGRRIKRVQNGEEFWYNIAMSYEDAIKKAEENAKFFPWDRSGV